MYQGQKVPARLKKALNHQDKNAPVEDILHVGKTVQTILGVRTGPGKPGILFWHFPGLESPGKRPPVLESSGNLFNSTKK